MPSINLELDGFIKDCVEHGINTCSEIAVLWMEIMNVRYTDMEYHHRLQYVNRRMKSLEKYGIIRYTGRTVSRSDRSKIWELVQ